MNRHPPSAVAASSRGTPSTPRVRSAVEEGRTQGGVRRTAPIIGAVTIANPAERTIFTVSGEADVLQIFVPLA